MNPEENTPAHMSAADAIASALNEKYKALSGPFIIGVGGPGGSGKTLFARLLLKKLKKSSLLTLDDYKAPRSLREAANIYGAHPQANDIELIRRHMKMLKAGLPLEKPLYCPDRGMMHLTEKFSPSKFIIADGETATYDDFAGLVDFTVFIDSDFATQLNTRFTRDIAVRGYTPEKAALTFVHSNLIEFESHGRKTKNRCDVCLFCARDYSLSIEKISEENIPYFPAPQSPVKPGG